jgi:lipoprotein-anchoring transpeptidase ErfK/SrfK
MTLTRCQTRHVRAPLVWTIPLTLCVAAFAVAQPAKPPAAARTLPAGLALQVALDRASFSPGVIDGAAGRNTRLALQRFQEARGLPVSGTVDDAVTQALPADPAVTAYVLTEADIAGPYLDRIPQDMMEKRTLDALAYTSVAEMLAERFHTTPRLLTRLNPGVTWTAGTSVQVPNVVPFTAPAATETRKTNPPEAARVADVRVSKAAGTLTVRDVDGKILFFAPVTSGTEHDPLPIGTWKVTAVYLRPVFHYNPELFWDADPSHAKAKLAAGPNNPVGVVWIDLDKEHYGLHGTPEPQTVGVTQSHGCVRLTNWDVMRLAALVQTGTAVIFEP